MTEIPEACISEQSRKGTPKDVGTARRVLLLPCDVGGSLETS